MKMLLLISGGIDSPVAGALALREGHELCAVHYNNYPFTDEKNTEKAKKNAQNIAGLFKKKIAFYSVKHGPNLSAIGKNCDRHINCILCRRMMFRIAEKIAEKEGCKALLTGENLAQVASQTLWNLAAEKSATKMQIVRPLLCLDKEQIISLAKEFETFKTSIERALCCTIVPKKPSTMAKKIFVEEEEKKMRIQELVEKAVEGAEKIIILPAKK